MSRSRPLSVTSVISKPGILCLPLFQLVLSDLPCEENEMCTSYKDQYANGWYIWFLLLVFLVTLLCGIVFFCLQCWLRPPQNGSARRTMAVFAVGDLDPVNGTEAAVNPNVGIHLRTQNPQLYPVPCFGTLGPPPPYEEILKSTPF
ncbi:transmembrane protein 207 [Camelus dromedarius]|uniref:Transmembrane protein 207 n=2 Tax=Camelus TaxID=9836 RepID=A0A8B6YKJ3_CAMFR|nr:transmembrane protein 207 [Camelus ferus]XP_010957667.1 transmembrane protein 207 isoform X2 [Camelus bactrianus]XP_010988417.1 transmembrane protein 207 [Camelus dromedarius]